MRENLLNFHKKWYSANIMNLVAISNQPMDQMQKWAEEKFSIIKNFDVEVPNLEKPAAYPIGQLNKVIEWVPITDTDELILYWPLPLVDDHKKQAGLGYLNHIFGHEGENSLMSYLKAENLALDLNAGIEKQMNSFNRFIMDITLTEKGMKNYEQIIEAVFQYAKIIEKEGP
jgi:insulysin